LDLFIYKMKIYTRAGDGGNTTLYDGSRVSKTAIVIEALGALDELNCDIGSAIAFAPDSFEDTVKILRDIQSYLLDLGSLVAFPHNPEMRRLTYDESGERVVALEQHIDAMTSVMPPLKNFILPGGTPATAYLHQSRATCRRAERRVVAILESNEMCNKDSIVSCVKFLNRFSDYLFTVARFADHIAGIDDLVYKQKREARNREESKDGQA
jgi:cob(I)alamin adenosyltransferase